MNRFLTLLMCFVLLGGDFLPEQTSRSRTGRPTLNVSSIIPDWVVDGEQPAAEFGYAVSSAGDVNGDGFDDVLIGIPKYGGDIPHTGAVRGYYGSPGGLSITPDWQFTGDQAGARYGGAVASAGDVNGDGFDDVIVGAHRYNGGESEEGAVFGFYGSPEGLGNEPDWQVEGDQVGGEFGYAVSSAGDVNGDGYEDVLVGARGQNSFAGAVFVYPGSGDGLSTSPSWVGTGSQPGASLGHAVSQAGDVNNDGFDDVIVGAPFFDLSEDMEDVGAVWVYLGAGEGLLPLADWFVMGDQGNAQLGIAVGSAGDVNGDGFDEVIVGATGQDGEILDEGAAFVFMGSTDGLASNPIWTGTSGQTASGYGIAVSGAGDINGDGLSDLLVGAYTFNDDQAEEGAVFIYLGSQNGLFNVARPTGNKAETWFGYSTGIAGDVNGDGQDEVIVGAPEYRISHDLVGQAYVFEMQLSELFSLYLPVILSAQQ